MQKIISIVINTTQSDTPGCNRPTLETNVEVVVEATYIIGDDDQYDITAIRRAAMQSSVYLDGRYIQSTEWTAVKPEMITDDQNLVALIYNRFYEVLDSEKYDTGYKEPKWPLPVPAQKAECAETATCIVTTCELIEIEVAA